jgi:hypothetical protein
MNNSLSLAVRALAVLPSRFKDIKPKHVKKIKICSNWITMKSQLMKRWISQYTVTSITLQAHRIGESL